MIKPLVYLRKKLLLPIRWKLARKKKASTIVYPPMEKILIMREDYLKEKPLAERNNNYKLSYQIQGKIDLIDWIIAYGSS